MSAVNKTQISLQGLGTAVVAALVPAFLAGCVTTTGVPMTARVGPVISGTSPCDESGCDQTACDPAACGQAASMSGGCPPGNCGTEGCVDGHCATGAYGQSTGACGFNRCEVPRELRKTALPEYRVEPPDVLLIEAVSNLRPPDDAILAGEPLIIQVDRTIPVDPTAAKVTQQFKTIDGSYVVGTDGYVNLGPEYGKVLCAGQPLAEVQRRVDTHLRRILTNPQVMVTLPNATAKQIVAGPHLVRPDGTVGLGIYGGVFVAGMSLTEAKCAIERHLSDHMYAPEVAIDVLEYRSKVYYVIADGGGTGDRVYRLPSTGNETVLDAVAQVNGLPAIANKGQIWIARPSPHCNCPDQLLHVDWDAIARGAQTCTNYQLLPGDRLYVKADCYTTFDNKLARITRPIERMLGLTLLGSAVVRVVEGDAFNNNN